MQGFITLAESWALFYVAMWALKKERLKQTVDPRSTLAPQLGGWSKTLLFKLCQIFINTGMCMLQQTAYPTRCSISQTQTRGNPG